MGEDELRALHSEALDLYKLYLKPGASHAVGVSQELAKEIIKSKRFCSAVLLPCL